MGAPFEVAGEKEEQRAPAAACSAGEGRCLVVWQEGKAAGGDIWGRFVGSALTPPFPIAATGAAEASPAVARGERAGEWAAAWQVQQGTGTSGWDMRWAVLDGEGKVLGGVEALSSAPNAQENVALAYDPNRGRYLAVWQDGRNGATAPDIYAQLAQGYTLVVDYRYDPLYRLVEASASDGAYYAFRYDAVGNRLAYTSTTGAVRQTTYTYDAADRLRVVKQGGFDTVYEWSERGELLSDGVQSYAWDAAGRLVGVSGPGGQEVGYAYDGAGNRVEKTVNGVRTVYRVDPFSPVDNVSQVLVEGAGGEAVRYLYGLDLLGEVRAGTPTYYGYDALSIRLGLGEGGALTARYRYAPFGEVVGKGPAGYGFTGERWDGEVGLLYLRARYYRPAVGRFVSRDPAKSDHSRPSTLNRYTYGENDPVKSTDPTGLYRWSRLAPVEHRAIEDWVEEHWGYWATHLEFDEIPGARMDIILLHQVATPQHLINPPKGEVYEIKRLDEDWRFGQIQVMNYVKILNANRTLLHGGIQGTGYQYDWRNIEWSAGNTFPYPFPPEGAYYVTDERGNILRFWRDPGEAPSVLIYENLGRKQGEQAMRFADFLKSLWRFLPFFPCFPIPFSPSAPVPAPVSP